MKICAKTRYACIAVLELARRFGPGEPVRVREIAAEHDIPSQFLVQILIQLKGAGYVSSTRGASGGYQLTRGPEEITLSEVMEVFDGPSDVSSESRSDSEAALSRAWRAAANAQSDVLAGVTFADLALAASGQVEPMYYI